MPWCTLSGHRQLIPERTFGLAIANYYFQADRIDVLEKDRGWHEEEFDFVLQYLRTILMKRMLAQKGARN